jgi:meiotically up-regulated gene 157 (Mug157) protein
MLSVELNEIAKVLDDLGLLSNVSSKAREVSSRIEAAIWDTTVRLPNTHFRYLTHSMQVVDDIFAYETNGFGGRYVMDDANVPVSSDVQCLQPKLLTVRQSLLSLPYLGFVEKDNPTYASTRKLLLSPKNPYYAVGKNISGIG